MTGFHQDGEGDWVAELACGHNQHVRHRPPFQQRPWVLNVSDRNARLGSLLACPLCDRAELPDAIRWVRSSPRWDEHTLPAGLRRAHRLAAGTWATIAVHRGTLRFSMASDPPYRAELDPASPRQAIPPEMAHEVEPIGPVVISIDFYTVDRAVPDVAAARQAVDLDEGGDPACWAGLLCEECGAVLGADPHRPGCSAAEAE